MENSLEFAAALRLIDERAAAFRAAAAAGNLDAQVPSCPEWTLADLVEHLGAVHRFWAAVLAAGPADGPPRHEAQAAPRERAALLAWSEQSAGLLLDALAAAGPNRGCWTWWGESQSPQTSSAVARHQVQEACVHTYDAQLTAGGALPLPQEAALDGVDEFLHTCCEGSAPWPFAPAVVEYHVTEGRSWSLDLSEKGTRTTRLPAGSAAGAADRRPDVSARGKAADLVLVLYGRLPIDVLEIEGDRVVLERLRDWEPDA